MRRLPVLAVLTVAALIAASAWLAIVAQSDPEPLPRAEYLPRDDDQSQQQDPETQPEPGPDGEDAEQQSPEQEGIQADTDQEIAENELRDDEVAEQAEADNAGTDHEAEEQQSITYVPDQERSHWEIIRAVDMDRRRFDEASRLTQRYTVKEGDTLVDIAELHGVDVNALAAANDLESADHLAIGDPLQIPSPHTYVAQEYPSGPYPYEGGELAWGTVTDLQHGVIHTAVVTWPLKSFPGQFAGGTLIIGCIHNRLIVEFREDMIALDPALADAADVRVYWRVDQGPIRTSRWTRTADVLSSPDPGPLIDSLRGANGLWLWPVMEARVLLDFWFSEVARMVETPVQANIDNCGR